MSDITELTEEDLTRSLAYAGFVLVAYELIKSLIVGPIRDFYSNITFGPNMPFKTYESDVLFRHKIEFEACLLYLRDFMKVIDSDDLLAIQGGRVTDVVVQIFGPLTYCRTHFGVRAVNTYKGSISDQ